ncbi:hypothetical protein [Anaerobiospirillum sp. NML120511]|uniref:hypothetical protein n=1 Tax=Anaerobiospirillum sp. NML120511 TaxID=2932819 RepID=UPI001FF452A6|nr:hypothetical protein [Anaerobiospirillum sp. NML120511]MCK0535212.1 hypothetical protein [Anaerobiospirillum sp. NML120511]
MNNRVFTSPYITEKDREKLKLEKRTMERLANAATFMVIMAQSGRERLLTDDYAADDFIQLTGYKYDDAAYMALNSKTPLSIFNVYRETLYYDLYRFELDQRAQESLNL